MLKGLLFSCLVKNSCLLKIKYNMLEPTFHKMLLSMLFLVSVFDNGTVLEDTAVLNYDCAFKKKKKMFLLRISNVFIYLR